MKTKLRNKFNVEGDLIFALSCIEPRISLVSKNKQAQPSIDCSARCVIKCCF